MRREVDEGPVRLKFLDDQGELEFAFETVFFAFMSEPMREGTTEVRSNLVRIVAVDHATALRAARKLAMAWTEQHEIDRAEVTILSKRMIQAAVMKRDLE